MQKLTLGLIALAVFSIIMLTPVSMNITSLPFLAVMLMAVGGIVFTVYNFTKSEFDIVFGTLLGLFSALVIFFITSSEMLYSGDYRSLMQVSASTAELPKLEISHAPLVSQAMAIQSAQKLLSQNPGMGSEVAIGQLSKQVLDGKLVWVGFLEHPSFFKWFSNKTTPGYVVVSANDPSDATLVTGKKLVCLKSAYGLNRADRAVWLSHPTTLFSDGIPMVDDSGNPVWIYPVYKNTIGMSGADTTGVVVLDAQTCETKSYSIDNAPSWISRIQPDDLIVEQARNYGLYVHGWLNRLFAGKDVQDVSGDVDLVFSDDGQAYWYQSMTSTGVDNGITGYFLINARTKEAFLTQVPGADEDVAKNAVLGLVREKQYSATNPLVFNVHGHPTYVMALTDATGITRGYGLVSLENYQIAVVGQTLADAARQFASKANQHDVSSISGSSDILTITGIIKRIGSDVRGGNTMYYLELSGSKHIFTGSSDVSVELPILMRGDSVTIKYLASDQPTTPISYIVRK